MYKAIKDNKIIAISDTDSEFPCLVKDNVEIDETHTTDDYDQYNGEYLLKSEIPAPTKEEQSKKREAAYIAETDPIQTNIDRLKDVEQTPEIVAEIEALRIERDEKIAAIKERYPYPTDPII
jgi:hypothetical protein